MTAAKRGRGRPKMHTEDVERSQVSLPKSVDKKLRKVGKGSLSAGIAAAAYRIPPPEKDPKARYVEVTDPDIIAAIKRAGLKDPIGGQINGKWYAEAFSLKWYKNEEQDIDV